MQFLFIDLAWEQFDPGARREVLEDLVVEAVEDLQQRVGCAKSDVASELPVRSSIAR
jgi:hypothetical protein